MIRCLIIFWAIIAVTVLFPTNAKATYLHQLDAEAGIILYEQEVWKTNTLIYTGNCHRYNAVRVSCLAKWQIGEYEYRARDYVHIHHGIEVFSPIGFETILVGEKGNSTVITRL